MGRLELNRTLKAYDPATPTDQEPGKDRQRFAKDIFARLPAAGSAPELTVTMTAGAPGFQDLTLLAQFAANMVDYIDDDDVMTAFHWFPDENQPSYNDAQFIVLGCEMPKVVMNEAYVEQTNGTGSSSKTDPSTYLKEDAAGNKTAQ